MIVKEDLSVIIFRYVRAATTPTYMHAVALTRQYLQTLTHHNSSLPSSLFNSPLSCISLQLLIILTATC